MASTSILRNDTMKKLLAFVAGAVFLLSCGMSWAAGESMIEAAKKRGTLRVGFSTFVPWAMQDKDGNFIGFEVDVATRLAKDLGLRLELMPTKWSGIIPALLTSQFDVIIGGMSITPERSEKVDFTIPYDYAIMDLVANKQKAAGFTTAGDFNKPGIVLSIRSGGAAKAAVEKYMPKAELRFFDEENQAIQEALSGRAWAFISSAPLPAFQALKHPDVFFRPLKEPLGKDPVGMALRKGDAESLKALNDWIAKAEADGWLKERRHYWFESLDWESKLK